MYNKYTPELKAKVARYAIENGNCQAARKFSTTDKVIDESSVRGWVAMYMREMERKREYCVALVYKLAPCLSSESTQSCTLGDHE